MTRPPSSVLPALRSANYASGCSTPKDHVDSGTFLSDAAHLENEIENDYGVRVDLVIVGDCESNERITAFVAAGREAAINAARWSGAISSRSTPKSKSRRSACSYVTRDAGFDSRAVPSDRQGIALSIRQRITQRGGEVSIKSTIGEGTEVQLIPAASSSMASRASFSSTTTSSSARAFAVSSLGSVDDRRRSR